MKPTLPDLMRDAHNARAAAEAETAIAAWVCGLRWLSSPYHMPGDWYDFLMHFGACRFKGQYEWRP